MKRFKKVFMALAFIFAGVLAFSLASNTKVHAEGTEVIYTVTSKTAVSTTGTVPTGSTAAYSQTYNTAGQATKDNSMTLTLSGYEGNKITGISLSMKSNKSGGSGSLSVTAGSTSIASKEAAGFNTSTWYGSWSTSYVDVAVVMTNNNYDIQKNENVVITIAATANSLYCQSFTITYESTAEETPTDKFKGLDLQEQLAFSYHYENNYSFAESIESGNKYLLGNVVDDVIYVAASETSNSLGVSSGTKNYIEVIITKDSEEPDYFTIVENSNYVGYSGSSTNLVMTPVSSYERSAEYLWSFDSNGRMINKSKADRFLAVNNAHTEIKAYSTTNDYAPAKLMTANSESTFKDAANNADRVTMRIGYTISKTLYESLEALGTTVTFGVRLNDTTNVECTKVVVDENTYKLFVAVNNIPLDKIDTVITACGYVSVDGTDTYTTEVNTYSVKTLAQEYLTNHADNEAVVTAKYALVYLAYYA